MTTLGNPPPPLSCVGSAVNGAVIEMSDGEIRPAARAPARNMKNTLDWNTVLIVVDILFAEIGAGIHGNGRPWDLPPETDLFSNALSSKKGLGVHLGCASIPALLWRSGINGPYIFLFFFPRCSREGNYCAKVIVEGRIEELDEGRSRFLPEN